MKAPPHDDSPLTAPRRIGYLTSQYPAPSHTFIRREVTALRAIGAQITTYSIRRPAAGEVQTPQDAAALSETAFVLPFSVALVSAQISALFTRPLAYAATLRLAMRHRAPGARAALWALFHFLEAILLAAWLRRDNIQHLHNHFANSGATVGLLASRFAGIGWSLTLHGISETDYPAGLLLPEKVRHAEFVCCVSHFGKAQAMRITPPTQWDKFTIARCGIDLAALPAKPDKASVSGGTIVCVGRLSPEKAQAGLLQVFGSLAARHPDWRLLLVGDGPDREALAATCTSLGLADRVTFAGRLGEQDTLAAIAGADMLVVPSFMEGLPVVLMEAMALGVPVVSSCVAGVPELVTDGVSGLLFPASDFCALEAAIERLITNPATGEAMTKAARQRILDEFTIEKAVRPLVRRFIGDTEAA